MTVGLHIHGITTEIGTGSFFHAFFSTISYHLEPKGWGTVYPVLMHKLYQGGVEAQDAGALLKELRDIHEKLQKFRPNQVIWDIEDLSARPPWGDDISPRITDLSNYFVTSGGRDLFEAIIENMEFLKKKGGTLTIVQYQGYPLGPQIRWEP